MADPAIQGSRVAFFGGSFDPPHRGHLAVAHAARAALQLDSVLFAPVGAQPLKPHGSTAGFADRVAMTRLAIANEPAFAVSLVDAPTPTGRPNYTIDTLERLRDELPGGGTLFCLMGADSFHGLRQWHRGAEIPFVAPLIVASRPGQPLTDLASALPPGLSIDPEPALPGAAQPAHVHLRCLTLRNAAGAATPFYLLPGLHIDISASQIRSQIRRQAQAAPGRQPPEHELLPPAVSDYIATHNLYRQS
ncbi:MAG: nicotinate (nicotinamide) nucleotide adenylyltransferase [Acidobacteriota bacterium]|nr:nicotinate (nicotinamide) nucleotide adenylyltransferase [Acidobacteriota bacterium]